MRPRLDQIDANLVIYEDAETVCLSPMCLSATISQAASKPVCGARRSFHLSTVSEKIVLTIDVGGSHVKIRKSNGIERRKADSGPDMTPDRMVKAVRELSNDWQFDAITIGYPGIVSRGKIMTEPHNLGQGWVDFDFEVALGGPVRLLNDALMQAVGSYSSGRMLFLGLGTGLGSAMVVDHVCLPMELAHLPYRNDRSFEDYIGDRGIEWRGKHKWRTSVFDVVSRLQSALQPQDIVIGGGNVDKLKVLPPGCRRGENENAFRGGFRVWLDDNLSF
jgi:polyphosphate glucokinase